MNTRLKYIAKPIKTASILLVVMFLLGIIQLITINLYWEFSRARRESEKPVVEKTEQEKHQWDIHESVKNFAPDGTLYLVSTSSIPGKREGMYIVKDRDGKVLFEGNQKDNPYAFIQWFPTKDNTYYYSDRRMRQEELDRLDTIGVNFSRHLVVSMVNPNNKRIGNWFFDTKKRIFKYYDINGEKGGYLGTNGYTENKSEAAAFEECIVISNWLRPNSYDPMMVYQSKNAVYQIDFRKKQVNTLIKTDNDPILRMTLTNWREQQKYDYRPHLSALTESKKVYLLFKHPDQRIEIQLSDEYPGQAMPLFTANEKTIFAQYTDFPDMPKINNNEELIAWHRENHNKEQRRRIRLFEVTAGGVMNEKTSFTWIMPARPDWLAYQDTWQVVNQWVNSTSSPVPAWTTIYWLKTGAYHNWSEWKQSVMRFISAISNTKLSINLSFMTLFAALALRHGWLRRTHTGKLVFWVAFVFLFNLPGLLTYLALNHTALIHCAECGKKRGLEQDTCCRCQAALPLPKTKETDLVMTLSA